MLQFETKTDLYTDSFSGFSVSPERVLFFDIETTGFSPDSSYVYLIGAACLKDNCVRLRQWFLDDIAHEKELVSCFLAFASDFELLVHYNGTTFDLPFLLKKCRRHRLADRLSALSQEDIYKRLTPFRRLLGLKDLKQKTVEQRVGLERKDCFSGGDLIPVYAEFLGRYRYECLRRGQTALISASAPKDNSKLTACTSENAAAENTPDFSDTGLTRMPESPAKALLSVLLLHNREDLTGLLAIAPLRLALSVPEHASAWEKAEENQWEAVTFILQDRILSRAFSLLFPEAISRPLSCPQKQRRSSQALPVLSAEPCAGQTGLREPPGLPGQSQTDVPPASVPPAFAPPAVTLSAGMSEPLTLRIPYIRSELKYFFDDYKNYYYLPLEDRAIHKSVAEFVDRAYRKKAMKETCYQKKSGCFLPQPEPIFTPAFRISSGDSLSFFEPSETLWQDEEAIRRWIGSLLRWLIS